VFYISPLQMRASPPSLQRLLIARFKGLFPDLRGVSGSAALGARVGQAAGASQVTVSLAPSVF